MNYRIKNYDYIDDYIMNNLYNTMIYKKCSTFVLTFLMNITILCCIQDDLKLLSKSKTTKQMEGLGNETDRIAVRNA